MIEPTLYDCIAGPQLAAKLERYGSLFAPEEDGILFREGDEADAVYYLKAGEGTLAMLAEEKKIVSMRIVAGSVLGLPAVIGGKPFSLTAKVAGPAEIYRIDRDNFKAILEGDAGARMDALRILAAEVRSARIALRDHLDRWMCGGQ